MDCIKVLISIAQVVVAGFGVWVAYEGLQTWKKKLKGTMKFDLAVKLLKQSYLFRDKMDALRFSIYRIYKKTEDKDGTKEKDKLKKEKNEEWKATFDYFFSRQNDVINVLAELEVLSVESEIFFGDRIKNNIQELRKIYIKVRNDIEVYLRNIHPDNQNDYTEIIKDVYNTIWRQDGDKDEIHKNTEKIVNEITDILSSTIKTVSPE